MTVIVHLCIKNSLFFEWLNEKLLLAAILLVAHLPTMVTDEWCRAQTETHLSTCQIQIWKKKTRFVCAGMVRYQLGFAGGCLVG